MRIDFNNARKQAIWAYNRLTTKMNHNIRGTGEVEVMATVIQEDMDFLRNTLISIACSYDDGNPDFRDLSDDIGNVAEFNAADEVQEA